MLQQDTPLCLDLAQVSSLLLVLISNQLPCPSPSHNSAGIKAFLPAVVFHPFADYISKHTSFLSICGYDRAIFPWTLWTLAFSNFPGGTFHLDSPEVSTLAMSSAVPSGLGCGKPSECSSGTCRGNLELAVSQLVAAVLLEPAQQQHSGKDLEGRLGTCIWC